jgi:hypothetical protein
LAKMFENIVWSAVSLTPPTIGQRCHWKRTLLVSDVIDATTSSQQCHLRCRPQNRQFQSRIFRLIRIYIQKGCKPWISVPGGVVQWKKSGVENLVTQSLYENFKLHATNYTGTPHA